MLSSSVAVIDVIVHVLSPSTPDSLESLRSDVVAGGALSDNGEVDFLI